MYYAEKLDSLRDVFGVQGVALEPGAVLVGGKRYPILDDVIILTEPSQYTPYVRGRLAGTPSPYPRPQGSEGKKDPTEFAADIQATFGAEWTSYSQILPEHKTEFLKYFDLVEPGALAGKRVCDLGCGSGRWARPPRRTAFEAHSNPPKATVPPGNPLLHTLHNILWTSCRYPCILCICYFTFIRNAVSMVTLPQASVRMKRCHEC